MNLILELKNLANLTASEEILVTYILEHPEKVIHFSPKELAEDSYVSVSTIYRLISKLNLEGLNQLKLELVKYLKDHPNRKIIDIDYPISSKESNGDGDVMSNLATVYDETIQSTMTINTLEALENNTTLLYEAAVIDIYTSSANLYFAQNFQFQMQEIGKNVHIPIDDYMQNLSAANSDSSHLAIVVSYEGRGTSVKKIMHILKKNQCKILLITSKNSSLLDEPVDGHFFLAPLENHYNKISSFSTRTSLLYILDSLYLSFFNLDFDRYLSYKLENYQKMNPTLT